MTGCTVFFTVFFHAHAVVGTPGGDMMVAATSALDEDDLHDVLDVEALLEAYYLAADNTLAQLMNIGAWCRA